MSALKNFVRSVGHGIAGVRHVAKTEANMRWHLLATIVVIVHAVCLRITPVEWAIVVGCIGVMLALESLNTALERLADRVSTESDPLIGQAKDAAAGAVLIMSIASVVIGLIVFLPKLLALLRTLFA